MLIRVNAELFRAAAMCCSTEQTRYYLSGVYIAPHEKGGAVLVTTDGHRMLVIHDKDAVAPVDAIVRLSPDAMKQCKRGKGESLPRVVEINTDAMPRDSSGMSGNASIITRNATSEVVDGEYKTEMVDGDIVGVSPRPIVDGTFPDWQRIMRDWTPGSETPAFAGESLASFATVGKALREAAEMKGALMRVQAGEDGGSAALVRWGGINNAFGVLMPVRMETGVFPDFYNPIAEREAAKKKAAEMIDAVNAEAARQVA